MYKSCRRREVQWLNIGHLSEDYYTTSSLDWQNTVIYHEAINKLHALESGITARNAEAFLVLQQPYRRWSLSELSGDGLYELPTPTSASCLNLDQSRPDRDLQEQ